MNEVSKKIKLAIDHGLAPLPKEGGFRKNSTHYWRNEGEALQVINVQSSQWNTAASARFTINIGVHFPTVARMLYGNDPMPPAPKEYDCMLRTRIGMLMPSRRDHWWEVTPETHSNALAEEVAGVCRDYIFPWLRSVSTVSGAAEELERSWWGGPWAAAAARLVLGERERAAQLVRRAIESLTTNRDATHPANTEVQLKRIQEMQRWAAEHGLPGFVN